MLEPNGESILIVEDDPKLRELLADELEDRNLGVEVAANCRQATGQMRQKQFDLVVCDLNLPDGSGLDLLQLAKAVAIPPRFAIITAFGAVPQAVEALKKGADDFLTKPLDLDHFAVFVDKQLETQRLKKEAAVYRRSLGSQDFHGMVGRSSAMLGLFQQLRQLARSDGPVLVCGESGVGKELVARAIHLESTRSHGPFIAVNCAGFPDDLLESELFGHIAGAFTGAMRDKQGLFAEASGGSFFLDEVGEMSAPMQAKLLRVIQEQKLRPLGSNKESDIDVRMITATNRDLELEMNESRFREDLFYRLETFSIYVPPLRDRMDDLEPLIGHIIGKLALKMKVEKPGLSPDFLARLRAYSFPGNVRELENILERAMTFCGSDQLKLRHLPSKVSRANTVSQVKSTSSNEARFELLDPSEPLPCLSEIDRRYLHYVLAKVDGNKQRAAAILGIGRKTLYRYLKLDK